ncbi:MAG TPA: PIG-L family deacetylase [Anaerolineae bacterium]
MRTYYDAVYLSPHLDDVAYSCGGRIFTQTDAGQSVLIVTVMAGDPPSVPFSKFARLHHERWQLVADTAAGRRAEDVAACRILGADYLHWQVPDCIYRLHPETAEPLYVTRDDIFGAVHRAEAELLERLSQQMRELPGHGKLFVPLTAGHHVDHQLVRAAAERRFGKHLLYYEDYPYAQLPGALAAVIPPGSAEWRDEVLPLTEAAVQARVEAMAAFISQVSTFFTSRADLEEQIGDYVRLVGGEQVWRRRSRV